MPIRRNIITGDPILLAPERAARPGAFGSGARVPALSGREGSPARCPFCPGHESDTPSEILRIGDPWRVRVFPNKYPAVSGHEIIVESPRHEDAFDRLEHAAEVVGVFIERYGAHADAAFVSLFRNHGHRGGASIDHLHSQLIPLTFVPPRIAVESTAFARATACPLCSLLEVVIDQTPGFTWLAPSGSCHAYQQWVVPKRHVSEMTALSPAEVTDLAQLLRRATAATATLSESHNLVFVNFPRQPSSGHFYVDLFPRMTQLAGFELGTGTYIDIIDPATAARVLRNAAAQ